MGQWIKKVFAYDGMFFQMFPSYSNSLRVRIIYLEKLESEHETASIKTMVKNSVNTKMRIFCYYQSKNTQTSTNLQICQKSVEFDGLDGRVYLGLCLDDDEICSSWSWLNNFTPRFSWRRPFVRNSFFLNNLFLPGVI